MGVLTTDLARRQALAMSVVREPCFTAEDPPLAMGCALCGHPPYGHGCAILGAHEYEVPSAELMAERLRLYRALGLHRRRMCEAEFCRDHACVAVPEPVDSVLEAAPFAAGPAVVDALEAAEVIALHPTTSLLPDTSSPSRDDVRPTAQAATWSTPGRRRRAILHPPPFDRVGVGARTRHPTAMPEHAQDAPTRRPRSYLGRVYPPNRPEPVGWHQQRQPTTFREGVR
ncbi:hypothetical protein [Nonomuraea longicatena]|uniref:Uncharacterized protein n=1 Tax=Nonomuraea longicatena TaxID=83682 RepID=A0ABP4AE99_9ACTN